MAKAKPLTLAQRARRDPAVLRRALRNPAKRAKLPDNMIPRRFKPIVPGSAVTNKALNRESRAASRIKYGPLVQAQRQQVGEARAYQRDIGNYYDDYVRQVQEQSRNVNQIGQQASQQIQGLQAGVTGLAAADLTQLNQAATKDAAARGATPGDLAQMASGAAATRQALVGSYGTEQAARNAANAGYASNRANVVAPGQKLGAVAQAHGRVRQAREDLAQTKRERGAFRFTYGQERRADEAKNVLAQQALGLDVAKAGADAADARRDDRRAAREDRRDRIEAGRETPQAREGAKYGYGPKEWKALGSSGRSAIIKANKAKPADGVYSEGAFAGKTKSEVQAMTPGQRQRLVDRYANRNDKPGDKSGPDWLTPGQSGAGLSELPKLKDYAGKAKTGAAFVPGHKPQPSLGRYQAEKKIQGNVAAPKHPALLRAALDAVYDGHISAYTGKMLIRAGYKPLDVARALGVPSHRQYMKTTTGRNTGAYGRGAGPQPQGHA